MSKCEKNIMSTLIALVLLAVSTRYCFAQKIPPKRPEFYQKIDQFVKVRADSIDNIFKADTLIPKFLYNKDFDLDIRLWASMHEPNSLRFLIIKRVKNINSLEFLQDKNDPLMHGVPETDSPIPFRKYSFYELITYRINELRTERNYFQFKKKLRQ